jgi:hypothetical protein
VQLLTKLGLDTGFTLEDISAKVNKIANAGLEHDIRVDDCPYIVKSPWFCEYAHEVINRKDISIDHIFIPMRDVYSAAESRREVIRKNRKDLGFLKFTKQRLRYLLRGELSLAGGTVHTASLKRGVQEDILRNWLYNLMLAISGSEIPVTLLHYPKLTQDPKYLYNKVRPILSGLPYSRFAEIFLCSVKKELVHNYRT